MVCFMSFPGTYEVCNPTVPPPLTSEEAWEECEAFCQRISRRQTVPAVELTMLARYLALDREGGVMDLVERVGLREVLLNSVLLTLSALPVGEMVGELMPFPAELTVEVLSAVVVWASLNTDHETEPLSELYIDLWERCCIPGNREDSVQDRSVSAWTNLLLTEAVSSRDTHGWACLALKYLLINCRNDFGDEVLNFVVGEMGSPSSRSLYLISQLAEVEGGLRDRLETLDMRMFMDQCRNEVPKDHEFYALQVLCQLAAREEDIVAGKQLAALKLSIMPILLSIEEIVRQWPILSRLWELLCMGKTEAEPMTIFNSSVLVAYFASRLSQEGGSDYSKEEGCTMASMCLVQITSSLTNSEISSGLENFLASVPSLDERRSFHKVFGKMVKQLQNSPQSQRFWDLWNLAHETNETSIGLTPGASLNLTLSPVSKDEAAAAGDDTFELDQTREEEEVASEEYGITEVSMGTMDFLKRQNNELRRSLLTEQRRLKEAQEEQARSVRAIAAKDSLLKDTLERLQMSLIKQEQMKDGHTTATAWAAECEDKLLLAREEFENGKVELIAKSDSLTAAYSRLDADMAKMKVKMSTLETMLEVERCKQADMASNLEMEQCKAGDLLGALEEEKAKQVDLLVDLESQRAENVRLEKEAEKVGVEVKAGRDKIKAQERRLKKAEKESSKHKEILKYIADQARVEDDIEDDDEDDFEKENVGGNDKSRLSLSIQETLNRHLSQDVEEEDM